MLINEYYHSLVQFLVATLWRRRFSFRRLSRVIQNEKVVVSLLARSYTFHSSIFFFDHKFT